MPQHEKQCEAEFQTFQFCHGLLIARQMETSDCHTENIIALLIIKTQSHFSILCKVNLDWALSVVSCRIDTQTDLHVFKGKKMGYKKSIPRL